MNTCIKCNELKPIDEFCKDRTKKTGYKNTCKVCQREYVSEWRKDNPKYMSQWYKKNPRWRETWKRNNPEYHKKYRNEVKPCYDIWHGIVKRCTNPSAENYEYYGGRGVRVCDRWLSYDNFIADMGERPTPEHEIDRIDNNGDYNKANCRWTTRIKNAQNTRRTKLTMALVEYIKELFYKGWVCGDIALIVGVNTRVIRNAIECKTYNKEA